MRVEYALVTQLILASGSPRRREILAQLGIPFVVRTSSTDETPQPGETPQALVARLSRAKGDAVARMLGGDALVLAADTIVVIDGLIIGKPVDEADAVTILTRLRGRPHEVFTGLTIAPASGGADWTAVCRTLVHMRAYSDAEIGAFIASRRPFDKAGAYAIQDPDFHLVRAIEGCYMNVMGLPLCEVIRGLREMGVAVEASEPVRHDCLGAHGEPCYALPDAGR